MTKQIKFMILSFLIMPSFAVANDPCDIGETLKVLSLNPGVMVREGEKISYGKIYKKGDVLPRFEEGTHVFLIDDQKRLIISHRFPDMDELNPVVTHRSLLNELRKHSANEPKLIALGEINFDHFKVSSITNKAGTAYLPKESLPALKKVLKEFGIPVTDQTALIAYNEVNPIHLAEHVAARARIKTLKDPDLNRLNLKLKKFRADVAQQFPSEKFPGQVDWVKFVTSERKFKGQIGYNDLNPNHLKLASFFGWIENYNDRYGVILKLKDHMTLEELDQLLDQAHLMEGLYAN